MQTGPQEEHWLLHCHMMLMGPKRLVAIHLHGERGVCKPGVETEEEEDSVVRLIYGPNDVEEQHQYNLPHSSRENMLRRPHPAGRQMATKMVLNIRLMQLY